MGMVYQWTGRFSPRGISAQTVGERIERIAKREGRCTPSRLVQEAEPEGSDLHQLFTWDNDQAAEKWRVHEARNVINSVVVHVIRDGKEVEAPAFVSVGRSPVTQDQGVGYRPVAVVVQDPEFRAEALQDALKEIRALQRRYGAIKELSPVWDMVDRIAA